MTQMSAEPEQEPGSSALLEPRTCGHMVHTESLMFLLEWTHRSSTLHLEQPPQNPSHLPLTHAPVTYTHAYLKVKHSHTINTHAHTINTHSLPHTLVQTQIHTLSHIRPLLPMELVLLAAPEHFGVFLGLLFLGHCWQVRGGI